MISDIQKKGPLIECVLNLSEGRDIALLDQISSTVNKVDGAEVIHRDIGYDAHRTVFTIAGGPDQVIVAITEIFKISVKRIDMSSHQGIHPCTGALDVIPIVPVSGISILDCESLLKLACEKWSVDFNVPICYYGNMSIHRSQSTLAQIRKGGYSKIKKRIEDKSLIINVGPSKCHERLGLSSCTVRDFMIAYNINLNTQDLEVAKKIARSLRSQRITNPQIKDVRFLAWYMEAYGCVQISTNIYNIEMITMHELYDTINQVAGSYGVKCAGSELIGLTPLKGLTRETDNYKNAIAALGLSSVVEFDADKRILEKVLGLSSPL